MEDPEEEIIRDVCDAVPILCPWYHEPYRRDRIDLLGTGKNTWHVLALCGNCDRQRKVILYRNLPKFKKAFSAVLGKRSMEEEIRLRSGPVSADYTDQLADVLGDLWTSGPEEEPDRPLRRA